MKNNIKHYIIFGVSLLLLISCGNRNNKKAEPDVKGNEPVAVFVPEFNADSAYHYVEKQVSFGPRVPNTAAHKACAA